MYLLDYCRQQLFFKAFKCDCEVDDVNLDANGGEIMWVGHGCRHIQPAQIKIFLFENLFTVTCSISLSKSTHILHIYYLPSIETLENNCEQTHIYIYPMFLLYDVLR